MIPPAHIRRLALVLLVLLGACNDSPTAPPLAAAVTITPGQQTFAALGITQQFTAVARDANGTSLTGKPVFWISLTPSVASVSSTGLVTAAGNGEAEILAVVDGVAGTVEVTVAQVVATIVLEPDAVSLLGVGALSPPLDAAAYDSNDSLIAGATFTWSVADFGLAAFDTSSRIATARSVGTTTVTVEGRVGVTATATITVGAHYYVDAVNGNDANAGTTAATAFEHIAHALSVAAAGNTIKVLPGEYSVLNGETFPLVGPAGVKLIGDEPNKGGGAAPTVVIRRAADPFVPTTFQPPAGAVIAGFTVSSVSRS